MITNNTSLDFEFVHTIIGMHTTIMTFPFIFDSRSLWIVSILEIKGVGSLRVHALSEEHLCQFSISVSPAQICSTPHFGRDVRWTRYTARDPPRSMSFISPVSSLDSDLTATARDVDRGRGHGKGKGGRGNEAQGLNGKFHDEDQLHILIELLCSDLGPSFDGLDHPPSITHGCLLEIEEILGDPWEVGRVGELECD